MGPRRWYNVAVPHAGVAELGEAPDSKSGGAKAPCRFEPDLRDCVARCGPSGLRLSARRLSPARQRASAFWASLVSNASPFQGSLSAGRLGLIRQARQPTLPYAPVLVCA